MASLGENFDAASQPAMDDFSPLPAGDYSMVVVDSEIKATKDLTGKYIKLKVEVIEGQFKGRLVFVNLNLWNQNPQAVEIAKKEFGALCRAVGVMFATDSAQVHNIPFIGKVTVKPGQNGFGPGNEIKGYTAMGGSAAAAPVNVQTTPAPIGPAGEPPINPATGKPFKAWEKWPGKQAK